MVLTAMNPSKAIALGFFRNQDIPLAGKFLEDEIGPCTSTAAGERGIAAQRVNQH